MPPENPETIAALRALVASQAEQIVYFKWAIGILCSALVAVCSFFVAWIRTLYDRRESQGAEDGVRRDKMLERVLDALATVKDLAASKARAVTS